MSEATIVVAESVDGKYGPQLKDVAGKFYSFGKFYKGETKFPPGIKLAVDLYVTEKGNSYINAIDAEQAPVKVEEIKQKKSVEKPKIEVKNDSIMSKEEWALKDRRISRQGCIQAAIHALGPVLDTKDLFKEAVKLADQMLEYVNQNG